jgi:Ring finger domain
MSCKSRTSQFFWALAFVMMWNMDSQKDCTVPMNRWVVIMWLLMTSKYLTLEEDVRENPMRLLCGSNLINPLMFYWIIKGIFYLKWAEGKSCFVGTSFTMVIFQMIVALTSILFFVVGLILIALACLSKLLYFVTKFVLGEERANRIPLFRIFRIFYNQNRIPSLNISQIDQLKAKIGQVVTEEQSVSEDFLDNPCPICWSNLELGQEYLKMKCRHHYHAGCLAEWLKKKSTCPMCNAEIKVSDYENAQLEAVTPTENVFSAGGQLNTEANNTMTTNIEMVSAPGTQDQPVQDNSHDVEWADLSQMIDSTQSIELSRDPDNSTLGLTAHEA